MNFLGRAVFDTSTLVSAALRPRSVPSEALARALAEMRVCVSAATLGELRRVLARPKFDRYLALAERVRFADLIERHSHAVEVPPTAESGIEECRDPTDRKFLALAVHCAASVIVSSDADLLVLDPFRGMPIMAPAGFLAFTIV